MRIPEVVLSLERPLGVFDSGVGGLTVLHALRRKLPSQDFIYFGDTARVPYGRKPPDMVWQFAAGITAFLVRMGVRGVVVACNTASSVALPELERHAPVPIWGVIDPGVEAARRATRTGRVGVIGTKGTIAAGVYQRKLQAPGLEVWPQACPMFVPLVEENLATSPEAELMAHFYLDARPAIDTLILGCTHYPVLRPVLERAVGRSVVLVDSAEVTAECVGAAVGTSEPGQAGRVVHFVTGDVAAYRHTAAAIGDGAGDAIELPLEELKQ